MFTIGICTSNRRNFLEQAIESVYSQDYDQAVEIVVSDDNSTSFVIEDFLKSIAPILAQKSIKIRLVKNDNPDPAFRAGEAAMRNQVISHSTGEFIIWLDDDDRLALNALRTYQSAITESPETHVFYGNLIRTDSEFKPTQRYQYKEVHRAILPSSLLLGSLIPNGGSCIKRSVFEVIGLYDTSYPVATDYQFWARASLGPIRFKHINTDVYLYRAHDSNAALDKEDDRFFDTNGRVCELLLQNCPPQYLFPFFEWKQNTSLAEYQVALAVLTLAKRNKRNQLVESCVREIHNNEKFKELSEKDSLQSVLSFLEEKITLTFEETAQTLSQIVASGQQTRTTKP